MFITTQIDKFKRNAEKLYGEPMPNEERLKAIKIPIYICIGLLLLISTFCMYFAYSITAEQPSIGELSPVVIYSDHVINVKNRFIEQLQLAHNNPTQTKNHKLAIPENNLFIRTKTIQYMYDYVEVATKEIYSHHYASDTNYRHIQCIETFTPALRDRMAQFETSVQHFINTEGVLFNQDFIKTLVKRDKITEHNHGGLTSLIGQFGIIATKDIDKNTCIGQYYGDEYIMDEFEAQFPWNIYGKKNNHPFKRKWDYYMTIPYQLFSDKRLGLKSLNATLVIDGYHSYNHREYVKDGGQDLSAEQSQLKVIYEGFVNDARKGLYQRTLTEADRIRKNSEFVYCSVDGVLLTFLIITKDVKANEQLFAYYGPTYG